MKILIGPVIALASMLGTHVVVSMVFPEDQEPPPIGMCNGVVEPSSRPPCSEQNVCRVKNDCYRARVVGYGKQAYLCCREWQDTRTNKWYCEQITGRWVCCAFATGEIKWVEECATEGAKVNKRCNSTTGKCYNVQ